MIRSNLDSNEDPAHNADTGTPELRPRRRWRRAIVIAVLVAVVVAVGAAHAPFARRFVARALAARALSAINTVLAVDDLHYNLLTLRFTATGVSLAAAGHARADAFFRAERVTVQLRPTALLGHLRFALVEIVRPRFHAERGPDGAFNLPRGGAGSGPAPAIEIGRLVVDRLEAGLLGADSLSIVVSEASIDMRPDGVRIRGRLSAGRPGWLRLPGGDDLPLLFDGEVGYQPGRLDLRPLNVRLGASTFDAEGTVAFDRAPAAADLALRADVGVDDVARLWPSIAPGRGHVRVSGRLAGPLSRPSLVFDATAAGAAVRGIAVDAVSARGTFDGSTLSLDPVTLDVARGRIAGTVRIGDEGSAVQAHWDALQLPRLLAALGVSGSAKLPAASLAGKGTARWDSRGAESLVINGATRVAATTPRRDGRVDADLALHVSGPRWSLGVSQSAGSTTRLTGTLEGRVAASSFEKTTIGGRLDVGASLEDVLPWVRLDADAAAAVARVHGHAMGSIDVTGTIRAPRATVAVSMPDLHVDGLGAGRLESLAHLDMERAAIDRLAVTLGRNVVEADGMVPFRRAPMNVRFSGTLDDVVAFAPSSAARWIPAGRVSVSGSASGSMDAVRIDGTVSADDVSWNGFRPGRIEGDVRLADRRVSATLDVPGLRAALAGSIDLSAPGRYEVSGHFDGSDLGRLADLAGRLGAPGVELTGTTRADVRLAGAADGATRPTVEARLQSLDGEFDGLPLHLLSATHITLSHTALALDPIRLQLGDATIDAGGALGAPNASLRASADISAEAWLPWLRHVTGMKDLRAGGQVHGELTASGAISQPAIAAAVTLSGGSASGPAFGGVTDVSGRLVLERGVLQLTDARGTWSNAPVQASGSVPLRLLRKWLPELLTGPADLVRQNDGDAENGLHLRASIASVDRGALAPWLSSEARARLDGRVSAAVEIDAPELTLAATRANASVAISELSVSGISLTATEPARLRLDSGRLVLEPTSLQTRGEAITVSGAIDFNKTDPTLDVATKGSVDLGIARVFVPAAISGKATADLRLAGDLPRPRLTGTITVADAAVGIATPRIAFSGINGSVALAGDTLRVEATGNANGGSMRLDGRVALDARRRPTGSLRLVGKDMALEWPEGLRSALDLDVTYSTDAGAGLLAGRITAEPGAYRRTAVPNFGSAASTGSAPPSPSALGATRLNLAVSTRSPGLVDNSFAEIEVDADLRVTGTIDQPAVGGSLAAREGGKVSLRGNNFVIDRGVLLFDSKPGARASLDMTARSRRSGYNIGLAVSGPFDNLRVDLSSDPPLAQSDLMSLIATGSVSNSMSSTASGGTTSSQDALVAGISSDILGFAGSSVGLDTVRVGQLDLDLLGQDVDPETRLTIGKSIGTRVDVLLSQNLRESGLTWVITVRPAGKFDVSYVSRDSESTSLELRHEVTFGGTPQPPSLPPAAPTKKKDSPKIARVTVSGPGAKQEWLAKTVLHAGDRFDFFEWQRDRERIEQALHDAGFLEALVAARRVVDDETPGAVTLDFEVTRGPRTTLLVRGFSLPDRVLQGMRAAWSVSVDDVRLLDDVRARARAAVMDEGYLAATVQAERSATDGPGEKTIVLAISPGLRVTHRRLVFTGNASVTSAVLEAEVEQHGLGLSAWRDPAVLAPALTDFYRTQGYFAARVTPGRVTLNGDAAELAVTIVEGPVHHVVSISVEGSGAVDERQVLEWAGVRAGDRFDPKLLEQVGQRIGKGFEREGYLDARATVKPRVEAGTGRVELVVAVSPGVRSVIAGVQVVGRDITRQSIVEHAMRLPAGTPAAPTTIDAAQRRLYETDAFRSVKIDLQPAAELPATPLPPSAASQDSSVAPVRPMQATVTLQEAPLYRVRYGVQFGSELDDVTQQWTNNPGFAVELRRRNVFGTAFGAAVGLRADLHKQSARGAINIPSSVFWPAISTLFITRTRTVSEADGRVTENELQVTYQDRWRLGRRMEWTYGYSLTGSDRHEEGPQTFAVEEPTVTGTRAAVYTAVVRDTRDSPFNATRGTFHSVSIEHGASGIGSDIGYMRYLFQGSYYVKAGPLVLAGATRVGAVTHLTGDNQLSYDIRFRTGGDREVRGYAEQSLHPPEIEGQPVGGQALLLLNGEVRFPIAGWLKAATFVDAGNAFTDLNAVSFRGLKVGMGLGVRLDTKYALFRVDFGIPVPREPGGSLGRWYFSIGQAF